MMPLPILCYHKVSDESEEGRWLNVHPETLASHIRFFHRRGFQFVRGASLSCSDWPARAVCLTFDDAYVTALENGLEVMSRYGVTGTYYAVSNNVGKESSWDPGREGPLADWDWLAKAAAQGHEISNHTADHANLGDLPLEEQISQIQICDAHLKRRGFASGSFCFPYGGRSELSSEALKRCGHTVGMALGKRPALPTDDRLALPRLVMSYGDRLPMLLYKLYVRPRLG